MPSQTIESLVPSVLLFTPDFYHQKLLLHPLHNATSLNVNQQLFEIYPLLLMFGTKPKY